MALTPNNWALTSYTTSTWTDLVTGPAIVRGLVISVGANAAVVKVRIAADGASVATLIPNEQGVVNTPIVVDLPAIVVESGQTLQVQASLAGVEFSAHGVTY